MFSLFVKDHVDWVDLTCCVESVIVGVCVCICDKSEGFVLGCLQFVFGRGDYGFERDCCVYDGRENGSLYTGS